MLNKKYIVFVLFVGLCLMSAVSAADINQTDELANMDDIDELSAADDGEVLSTDHLVDVKTFDAIQTKVNNASSGDRILLDGTYESSGSPITVNKDLTIVGMGKGATLNAKASSGIIVGDGVSTVTLKNIIFSAASATNGAAIYKANAENCTFKQCTATQNGGAMYNGTAIDCLFVGCVAGYGGGAYDSTIINSTFKDCEADKGGAMYAGEAYNTRFEWCNKRSATDDGGVWMDSDCVVYEYEDPYEDADGNDYGTPHIERETRTTVYYDTGSSVKVTISYSPSEFYEYEKYQFKIKGKVVASGKTSKYGVAKFKITQNPGKYKVTVLYPKLDVSSYFYVTVKHVVNLKSVTVKKSAKNLKLTATLKQGKKVLKKKTVTFKFNGKKYTAKTNNNGVAKVTIPKYVLKKLKVGKQITYQATYKKDTVKKTVKVKR